MSDRQGPETDGVGELEDGGVRTNAERQREDRDRAESPRPAQRPYCVAHVLPHAFDAGFPPDIARIVFDRRDAAHLDVRGPRGGIPGHAGAHPVVNRSLEVRAQLVVQLALDPLPAEQGVEATAHARDPRHHHLSAGSSRKTR